jgi:hypothetical protein
MAKENSAVTSLAQLAKLPFGMFVSGMEAMAAAAHRAQQLYEEGVDAAVGLQPAAAPAAPPARPMETLFRPVAREPRQAGVREAPSPARGGGAEPAGLLDLHFVVRLLTNPASQQQEVIGFLTFKDGIDESLFAGTPSEKTAHFTLRIEGLTAINVANTGNVRVQLRPPGQHLNIYLHEAPDNDWSRPEGFSRGKLVASYYERVAQLIDMGPTAESTATFDLVDGAEFTFKGKRYDFRRDTPSGVTAVSYFSMKPLATGVARFPQAFSGAGVGYTIAARRPRLEIREQGLTGTFIDSIVQPTRTFTAQFTFVPGGGMVGSTFTVDGHLAVANGVWRPTGERQYALTFHFLDYDAGKTFVRLKVRASIQLNESYDEYTGTGQMDYYDATGKLINSLRAPVAGKRMPPEPPPQS